MEVMDLVGLAWTLAKEIGKGGGGSTEEPTVCMALLPVALGVAWAVLKSRSPGGRTAAPKPPAGERKVQTA
jgi:hypothetical protein